MGRSSNELKPTILVREGEDGDWRQYFVVTDERVAIVHMVPALCGWNIDRVHVQGSDSWSTMSRDEIVAWRLHHDGGTTLVAGDIGAVFYARLLTVGGAT